jgi:hypothetical protein
MVVLLFFFTGLILFSIAIIGSYVGRIYIQGQNQPLYWLADARNFDPEALNPQQAEIPEIKISQRILQGRKNDRP